MENPAEKMDAQCGCDPFPTPLSGGCEGCSPNVILTCEEESILAKMRELKGQVRSIEHRLHAIQDQISTASEGPPGPEWAELSGQLESLRNQWKDWTGKLDAATLRKMEILGHFEP